MTELEKMQRAKMYMDRLANGINPITEAEVPEDSILNNVRLSRCFFYVSDILEQVIQNGGVVRPQRAAPTPRRARFVLTEEQRNSFSVSADPISITELTGRLNGLIDSQAVSPLPRTAVTNWLLDKGFLEQAVQSDGKKRRVPTEQGTYIGLCSQLRQGPGGEYPVILYTADAQRFILDNLDDILQSHEKKR